MMDAIRRADGREIGDSRLSQIPYYRPIFLLSKCYLCGFSHLWFTTHGIFLGVRMPLTARVDGILAVLSAFSDHHAKLAHRLGSPMPVFHVSTQRLGAGKTTFGRNLINFVCEDLKLPASQRVIEPRAPYPELLAYYKNFAVVELSLADTPDNYRMFSDALSSWLVASGGAARKRHNHSQRFGYSPC